MLSRLVTTFLPRSKHLLITWLQSPSAVILEPKRIKSLTVSPSICHEVVGPDAMILVFRMLSLSQLFHSLLSLSARGSLVSLSLLSAVSVVSSEHLRLLIFIYWKKKKKNSEVIVRCYLHWFKGKVPHSKVSARSGHRNLSILTLKNYLLSVRVTLAFQSILGQANLHISSNTKSVKNNNPGWNSHG